MKLTKSKLKQIIKEELQKALQEQPSAVEADEQAVAEYEEEERRRCPGTKKFYRDKCRYPDEIKASKRKAFQGRRRAKQRKVVKQTARVGKRTSAITPIVQAAAAKGFTQEAIDAANRQLKQHGRRLYLRADGKPALTSA